MLKSTKRHLIAKRTVCNINRKNQHCHGQRLLNNRITEKDEEPKLALARPATAPIQEQYCKQWRALVRNKISFEACLALQRPTMLAVDSLFTHAAPTLETARLHFHKPRAEAARKHAGKI